MRVSPHLIQKTVELMRQYGFAARLVPAPLVRVGNDTKASYEDGVIVLAKGSGDYDLVHELVHHYQVDQGAPSYTMTHGEEYFKAWATEERERQARIVSLAFIRPSWSMEDVVRAVDQQTSAIVNGDYSSITGE